MKVLKESRKTDEDRERMHRLLPCLPLPSWHLLRQFVDEFVDLEWFIVCASLVVILPYFKGRWWCCRDDTLKRRRQRNIWHWIPAIYTRDWLDQDSWIKKYPWLLFRLSNRLILTSFSSCHETFTHTSKRIEMVMKNRAIVSCVSCTQTTLALFCCIIAVENEFHVTIERKWALNDSWNPWPDEVRLRFWESLSWRFTVKDSRYNF
jgi:hypothetical protein